MKKSSKSGMNSLITVLILLLTAVSFQLNAKVLTVSNSSTTNAQYTSLQNAIDAASSGDTIYVHGSLVNYEGITLNKKLVLIGPGYWPLNPTTPPATIDNVTLDTLSGISGASRSCIMGLNIGNLGISGNFSYCLLADITVKRNNIFYGLSISMSGLSIRNWFVEENRINNLIPGFDAPSSGNILIRNNVIGYFPGIARALVVNNVIQYQTSFSECSISNNIFVAAGDNNSSYSTFNNNLFAGAVNFTAGTSTNVGTIIGDPQFVGGNNYNLLPGSLAIGAGTDDKDLGIYGGSGFTDGGLPPVPIVYFYNLAPNYILTGGTLQITVKVKNQ